MKLLIDQSPEYGEVEITIKCGMMDERLAKLVEQIRMYSFSVTGKRDGRTYQLPLDNIYYFESVDNKTFAYAENDVYECALRLYELEAFLEPTGFVRISKAGIMNTAKLESVRALMNGRMEARLVNEEKLVISRHYVSALKEKLGMEGGENDG